MRKGKNISIVTVIRMKTMNKSKKACLKQDFIPTDSLTYTSHKLWTKKLKMHQLHQFCEILKMRYPKIEIEKTLFFS